MIKHHLREMTLTSVLMWLGVFALLPFILLLTISFMTQGQLSLIEWHFTLANYRQLFHEIYLNIFIYSLVFAFLTTVLTLLLAYPAAYFLSNVSKRYKSLLMMLMIIPFWTSSLIRVYAMMALVKTKGIINSLFLALHIIHKPLLMLYTNEAVLIGMAYNLLPYMVLPLYSNFEKLDHRIFDAARDLGAGRWRIFSKITLPLTLPGIMVGILFVFLPAMTIFYIPDLLGGAHSVLIGNLVKAQFITMSDWPGGCATSVLLTLILLLLMVIYRKRYNRGQLQEFM